LDEDGSIRVALRPQLDEAIRVLLPIVMRRPGVKAYRLVCTLFGLAMLLVGAALLFQEVPDPVFGTVFVLIGIVVIVAPMLIVRRIVARGLAAEIQAGVQRSMTFSTTGIDTKSEHTSSHFDWEAVARAQRIPEGLLIHVGRATTFVARREFESEGDFDRAVGLFRGGLGPKFQA